MLAKQIKARAVRKAQIEQDGVPVVLEVLPPAVGIPRPGERPPSTAELGIQDLPKRSVVFDDQPLSPRR